MGQKKSNPRIENGIKRYQREINQERNESGNE
jgi:hypothetical protein